MLWEQKCQKAPSRILTSPKGSVQTSEELGQYPPARTSRSFNNIYYTVPTSPYITSARISITA